MAGCRRFAWVWMGLCACTEPNPFAGDTGTQTDPGSTAANESTSADSSPDDTRTTSDGNDASTSSDPTTNTTGEAACPLGTHVCVALAPDGWSGPVALIDDAPEDPEPACAAAFPTLQTTAFDDVVAPAADCSCDCAGPNPVSCWPTLVADNSAGCATPSNDWDFIAETCNAGVNGPASSYWEATTSLEGNCTPEPAEEIVDAEFGQRHTLCGADEAAVGACPGGEVCTPIPLAPFTVDALCIWAEGDLECPADLGYDARTLLFRDLVDDRGCSACACDLAGDCSGSVYLFDSDDCNALTVVGTIVLDGACVQVDLDVGSADISSDFEIDATCEPDGGIAEGAATGTDPVTLCCRS